MNENDKLHTSAALLPGKDYGTYWTGGGVPQKVCGRFVEDSPVPGGIPATDHPARSLDTVPSPRTRKIENIFL